MIEMLVIVAVGEMLPAKQGLKSENISKYILNTM
jgi:hypothetical protein